MHRRIRSCFDLELAGRLNAILQLSESDRSTLRAAAPFQIQREERRKEAEIAFAIDRSDLQRKVRVRKAGHQMLDAYVRWLEEVAEQQRKIASGTPVSQMDWLAGMLNAQADFTRQFAKSLREFPGHGAK
jgi:hypothetical protein